MSDKPINRRVDPAEEEVNIMKEAKPVIFGIVMAVACVLVVGALTGVIIKTQADLAKALSNLVKEREVNKTNQLKLFEYEYSNALSRTNDATRK